MARDLAAAFKAPLVASTVTRLVVDLNFRMDSSALYSDIVLPTATWYEKNDLNTSDMHPFIHPLTAAVDPVWECKSDWEIYKAIAKKLSEVAPEVLGLEKDVVALETLWDARRAALAALDEHRAGMERAAREAAVAAELGVAINYWHVMDAGRDSVDLLARLDEERDRLSRELEESFRRQQDVQQHFQQKGFLSEPFDTNIIINENGIKLNVDIANGQKTGYFLDQQDNRRAIQHIVKDADVLGAFSYTGSFEVSAAHYGAKSVLGLDISAQAVEQANKNAALNGLENTCRFECVNAFDVLKEWSKEGRQWDVVMLDPPSFTKSRSTIDKAVAGYKEINLRGIKLVKPGGFLVTSSCTNLVQPELFLDTIYAAAKDAKRKLRQVVFNAQSADHPIIRGQEYTHYLKFLIVQVL